VRSHYTKYEYRIPMRDGKHLFTSVYVPKDTAGGPYPFMMDRTPYSVAPYGEDEYPRTLGPSEEFQKAGYIFVYQDVRGRWMSEGDFIEMRPHIDDKKSPQDVDDASDTYDTIEFLLEALPNNNGKVGIWGISYPGFYTSASIIDSHPALVAASPQAPMTDLFMGDDGYHGGAFMLAANFGFYAPFFHPQEGPQTPKPMSPFEFGTPDHYRFFLDAGNTNNLESYLKGSNWLFNDQLKHDTYDAYWKARDLSQHMKNVKCAVLVVGGWYDAEDLSGPYRTFYAINKLQPGHADDAGGGPMGAWRLGARRWQPPGRCAVQRKNREYFRANIQFPFFEHYLKGKGAAQPKAVVFETGTNVWKSFDTWPPKAATAKTLYFHAGGKLSFDPPDGSQAGVDEYVSDPNHPVPFVGYTTDTVPQRYMVDDQRFAGYRPTYWCMRRSRSRKM
jgi:putative CocE/NonD family hydrolase